MKRSLFLAVTVICAAFLLASCTMTDSNSNSSSNSNNANSTKPADSKPADTKPGDTTASSGDIGVPECDAYIKKYEACLNDKVPAQARDMMKSSFEQARNSWREAAKTPQGKEGLAAACKQATDAAKQSMGAYGCDF